LTASIQYNTHFGDEEMIEQVYKMGRLEEKQPGSGLTQEGLLKTATDAKI
jgi:hypothetical protein